MLKTLAHLSMLAFMLAFSSSLTRADPIVITSGSLFASGLIGGPIYSFTGTNFSVTAIGGDSGFINARFCHPCVSGDAVSPNSRFEGVTLGRGTVTLNGRTFNNIFIGGSLMFTGPDIIMPVTEPTTFTLTTPFTLSGFLDGCLEPHLFCQTIVFSTEVSGSGLASIQFQAYLDFQGRTVIEYRNITYTFNDTTIPEPGSILLLTSGVAALVGAKLKLRAGARKTNGP